MRKEDRILIAGGSGFIGGSLAARLAADGYRIRATYRTREDLVPRHENIEAVQADLRDPESCARVAKGMDVVFMCAAHTSGAAVIQETPLAHVTPNVVMNTQMLEAAHKAGVQRFVFISSGCVYPGALKGPAKEEQAMEGQPHDSYFAAGWMKRYAEILCRTYAEKIDTPMPCTVVRPSNVYGPGDKFGAKTSHATAAQIRKVLERRDPLVVWGTGEDIRDVIFIDDFVEGIIRAASTDLPYLEVNLAQGEGTSITDILKTAMRVDGYDAKIVYDPSKPTTIPCLLFDTGKARDLLEFQARTLLADGIRKTLDWLRATPPSVWDR